MFTLAVRTLDHVLDVTADGADGGQLLLGSEPLLHLQGALVGHVHVQSQVLEAALQGAAGAGDGHHTGLHRGLDILRDLHALVGINGTHLDDTVGKNINY